jgi:hypothetical protein
MDSTQRLSEIIVPEVFNPYVDVYTTEQSRIRQAGIVGTVPGITFPDGGVAVNMPFWDDLKGESEVLEIGKALSPERIIAGQDIAVIHTRGKAWTDADLTETFTGSDPLGAIARKVGGFWARDEQNVLLATLKGVFSSTSMEDNILDISDVSGAGGRISRNSLIDAISLLGDAGANLTGIVCHSAVMYDLAKKELLDAKINIGDTNTAPEFATYLGRQVIYDDGCPIETITGGAKVYTTYIFGNSAIGFAPGNPKVPVGTQRDELKGEEVLVNRKHFVMHPRGVKWKGTFSGTTPSNVVLANGANWERVYEQKNVRIVAFKHLIG